MAVPGSSLSAEGLDEIAHVEHHDLHMGHPQVLHHGLQFVGLQEATREPALHKEQEGHRAGHHGVHLGGTM
eukprot:11598633-Alexandrium_andersonii.AAC.1